MRNLNMFFLVIILLVQCLSVFAGEVSFGAGRKISDYTEFPGAYGLDIADLDGDRYEDVLLNAKWNKNNGATVPVFSSNSINAGGLVKAEDMNRDGALDIISYNGNLSWSENKGHPPVFVNHLIQPNAGLNSFCIGDLDNDGNLDIIGGRYNIFWFKNNGGPQPNFSINYITNVTSSISFITVGDLDNDHDIDIVFGNGQTYWMENDGAKPPHFTIHLLLDSETGAVSIVDFNHDGNADILVGVNWCENDGAKPPGFIFHKVSGGQWFHSALGDFNGDGWMDYVSYTEYGSLIYWFENNGQTSTSFNIGFVGQLPYSIEPYNQKRMRGIAVGDVDRDGDMEPVLLHNTNGVVYFPNLRLSPKPVSLFEPNGGEHYLSGAQMPVSWRTDPAQAGTTVTLELWQGTSQPLAELAATDASPIGVGIHSIRLPWVPSGNNYRVRAISLLDCALFDFSDQPFTITSANLISPKYWLHYR